jgi:hypothetical protein
VATTSTQSSEDSPNADAEFPHIEVEFDSSEIVQVLAKLAKTLAQGFDLRISVRPAPPESRHKGS